MESIKSKILQILQGILNKIKKVVKGNKRNKITKEKQYISELVQKTIKL